MEQNKLDTILKWTACLITMSGGLATVWAIDPLNVFLLTTGGIVYLIWSIRIREWSLVVVNTAMLAIYGVGTVMRVIAYFG